MAKSQLAREAKMSRFRVSPEDCPGMTRSNNSFVDRALTVPFGRQGTGWEVAYAALFLISNESSYVNAHTLFLDAGHMAGIVRA
jgi:NAD(P)-dependent dehydrogenase (short-subunit alcohol dehydrogenase family)